MQRLEHIVWHIIKEDGYPLNTAHCLVCWIDEKGQHQVSEANCQNTMDGVEWYTSQGYFEKPVYAWALMPNGVAYE